MRTRISAVVFFTAMAFLTLQSFAQEETQQSEPSFGLGANVGLQYPYCDIDPAGLSLAGEAQMRFLLSNRFNIAVGLGYGQLADGFSKRTFHTNVFNADIKGNLYLISKGWFRPHASLGFGTINYTYFKDVPNPAKVTPNLEGKAFWDVAFIFGGGFDFHLSKRLAITAFADYRHTTTDGLDGFIGGTGKDGYLNARVGFVYMMGEKEQKPEEEWIAENLSAEMAETGEPMDEATEDILRQLGALGPAEDAEMPEAPAGDEELAQRIEELRERVNERQEEISELKSQLDNQDNRIEELQREMAQVQTAPSDFRATYQEALRQYSMRNYDRSIELFTALRNGYPQHKLASNCIYWVGENYFGKGNYTAAIEAFENVFDYQFSYKKDDATLMLGRSYHKLGQYDRARNYFQQLISQYPNSEYVSKAQSWLARTP